MKKLKFCKDTNRSCNLCNNLASTPDGKVFCGFIACNKASRFCMGTDSIVWEKHLRFFSNCSQCPRVGIGKNKEIEHRCLDAMKRTITPIIKKIEYLKEI